MKFIHSEPNVGFTNLFTDRAPSKTLSGKLPVLTGPYLQLAIPYNYQECNAYLALTDLGCTYYIHPHYIIQIHSPRNIRRAIEILRKEPGYAANTVVFALLQTYSQQLANKPLKAPAPQSINVNLLSPVNSRLINPLEPGSHAVRIVQYNGAYYVYKPFNGGRKISEIEVFFSFCYQLLLNEQTPRMASVYDTEQQYSGVVSRYIPNYVTVRALYPFLPQYQDRFIAGGLGRVMAAAYLFMEYDLNRGNVGLDQFGRCIKLDHDRSGWPLVCKYHSQDSKDKFYYDNVVLPSPLNSFPIHYLDLVYFPELSFASPYAFLHDCFIELAQNALFNHDKWLTFLKFLLVPDLVFSRLAEQCIRSEKTRIRLVRLLTDRVINLKAELVQLDAFKSFISTTPDLRMMILNEFAGYNAMFKDEAEFLLDLDLIGQRFAVLCQEFGTVETVARIRRPVEPVVQSSFPDSFDAIRQRILQLNQSVGMLGGVTRTWEGRRLILPTGAAKIFDIINSRVSDEEKWRTIRQVAAQRKSIFTLTIFNRRCPATQSLYDEILGYPRLDSASGMRYDLR